MGSEKRPYTSSGNIAQKRNATAVNKASQNNSAIAALYLGTKTHQAGFNMGPPGQHRNASQPTQDVHALGYP
jgi:hypothetical protein